MERFLIQARPQPYDVSPYSFTAFGAFSAVPAILLIGRSFFNVTNIYLSSTNLDLFTLQLQYINPFFYVKNLSSNNIGFSGIDISEYCNINSENYITIKLPNIFKNFGYFDIIVQNEAGFGILSKDSRVPFISSYNGAIDIQRPCISGIYINPDPNSIIIDSFITENNIPFITENNILFIPEK